MLCVPIKDKDGDVLGRFVDYKGVLQAINKVSNSNNDIFFNIEDEGVLKVLALILTSIL